VKPIRRVPGGTSKGGQFSAAEHQEAGVAVGSGIRPLPDVGPAGVEEIRALAASPDPLVRAEVTSSLRVPDDVLVDLASPEQPTAVLTGQRPTAIPSSGPWLCTLASCRRAAGPDSRRTPRSRKSLASSPANRPSSPNLRMSINRASTTPYAGEYPPVRQ
jgi:hypothetical protein